VVDEWICEKGGGNATSGTPVIELGIV